MCIRDSLHDAGGHRQHDGAQKTDAGYCDDRNDDCHLLYLPSGHQPHSLSITPEKPKKDSDTIAADTRVMGSPWNAFEMCIRDRSYWGWLGLGKGNRLTSCG